ncbi:hypothetical protein ACER0C_003116 [Sarotherodon galilaeus]
MALQQFVCCFTVVIIFFCKGCHSQQPICGRSAVNSSSITGVRDAAPGSWPWFTTVNTFSAGSLITDQWVLTAASSVPKDYSSMVVLLGSNSLSGPNPNEVRLNVINNNICLLKLSAPVNFTDYIQPICLASENSTFNNESSSWAIGFGGIGKSYTSVLITFITVFPQDKLGAPLMTQSKSVWLQSGVFSVPGCTASPSVYTPVSQYQKWISDTVTGTPPGFVTFTSPDGSLQTTAPLTIPPTTLTAPPTSPTCVGVFCSDENLTHFTHFTSLCVLVVLLHVFAGTVGK